MTQLILYEQARAALAEARRVDEVKDIRDKAEAIRLYAKMAGNTQMEQDAAELRLRAERRGGLLIADLKRSDALHKGGRPKTGGSDPPVSKVKLEDLGIDKEASRRFQRVSGIAEQAFEAMVARTRQRIQDGAGKLINIDSDTESKKLRRADRERELADKQRALPDRKFGVILADPEWKHVPWSDTGMRKSADNHYPTTPTDEIAARPVEQIAAADCVLFLWATVPMLPDALDVMGAWGFTYRSHAMWRKIYPGKQQGMGYWLRINHELLLIGTRGKIPCPAPGDNWGSVIEAPHTGKHSEKPEIFYELIEAYFPNLPKIELNARSARPGWDAWGLEAPVDGDGTPVAHDEQTGEVIDDQPAVIAQPVDAQSPHLNSDVLEIPPFLRRTPVASASNSNASAAGPPHEG